MAIGSFGWSCSERRQPGFDLVAMGFERLRQLEGPAELIGGFVYGKSGDVCCDLEQDPARLAEIERAEIAAVLLLGGADAVVRRELPHHGELLGILGGAEGDVVHRARAQTTRRGRAGAPQVDDGAGFASLGAIAGGGAVASGLGEVEKIAQDGSG